MFNNPFRAEALSSRNKRQHLDHLLRVTAPHEHIVLGLVCVLVIAFVVWILVGSVERRVALDGVLIQPGERYTVLASEPGHLVELLVEKGDRINTGDSIAQQTVPQLERDVGYLRDEVKRLASEGDVTDEELVAARLALLKMEAQLKSRKIVVSDYEGEVTAFHVSPGDFLNIGTPVVLLRAVEHTPLEVVVAASHSVARGVHNGMKARVQINMNDGTTQQVDGKVSNVTIGSLPGWLSQHYSENGGDVSHINVTLDSEPTPQTSEYTRCKVWIHLGSFPVRSLLSESSA